MIMKKQTFKNKKMKKCIKKQEKREREKKDQISIRKENMSIEMRKMLLFLIKNHC